MKKFDIADIPLWLITLLYITPISILILIREDSIPGNPDSGSNFLVSGLPILLLTITFLYILYKRRK